MPSYSGLVEGKFSPRLRLDRYAAEQLRLLSRSQLKTRTMKITLNGKAAKLSSLLKGGEALEISWADPPPVDLIPENIDLEILYEDDRVVVINKKAGMVVHPGAGNHTGTLANALLYRRLCRGGAGEGFRPGIVHRLDKDTSGVIIAAYDDEALAFLSGQFKDRKARKTYAALVSGPGLSAQGRIETRLIRDPRNRKRFVVSESRGKAAVTLYRMIRSWGNYSLLLLRPKTGRTHQLRVHMRHLGHPIVGDPVYGGRESGFPEASLMLHAKSLSLILPGEKEKRTFKTPLPPRFRDLIRALERDFHV